MTLIYNYFITICYEFKRNQTKTNRTKNNLCGKIIDSLKPTTSEMHHLWYNWVTGLKTAGIMETYNNGHNNEINTKYIKN